MALISNNLDCLSEESGRVIYKGKASLITQSVTILCRNKVDQAARIIKWYKPHTWNLMLQVKKKSSLPTISVPLYIHWNRIQIYYVHDHSKGGLLKIFIRPPLYLPKMPLCSQIFSLSSLRLIISYQQNSFILWKITYV